ncbi:MAG TPA: hypothetical protein VN418_03605 [Gammaproteobacteria bacterium]|nr:hypothetical protein [Gammaproteobacteria bacterium]
MKKSILEVYALAVCFVTVICFVIASGIGLYSIIGIANPEFTLPAWVYERHQSNDAFWRMNAPLPMPGSGRETKPRPPEDELTQQRQASYALAIKSEQRGSVQTLTKAGIVIFIDLIIFGAHWRIARRSQPNAHSV